jgi:predicted aminopeptidase
MKDNLKNARKLSRFRKWGVVLLLVLVVGAVSGCHTLSFYGQAIKGQYQMFAHEELIPKLMADKQTPARLKQRFELLDHLRAFAAKDLKLPVDDQYRKYVDVGRPFVVWNVEAAPEFSMQPRTWWYPLVGSLEYRGYFSRAGATNYAGSLRKKGFDVSVGGVEAYSTLGWFKDPVLNTFIFEPDADLAEIIFHELGHQRLFARGDTDFNEAFATTVGEEGARRWLTSKGDTTAMEDYLNHLRHNNQFVHLVMNTRARLEVLYGDERTTEGKLRATRKNRDVPAEQLRREKEKILEQMKGQYADLKASWGGDAEYDGWFARQGNNAKLNSIAAYYDFVPGFAQMLAQNGGDLEKFYQAAQALAKRPKKERHELLRVFAKQARTGVQTAAIGGR